METGDTESELAQFRGRIETALGDPLEEQWDEVLEQWTGATPAERRAVRTDVSALRTQLLADLREIDALGRLKRSLALQYLSVKCRWTMLDTRIQDQASRDGPVAEALLYRATCVGLLLEALDPLLDRKEMHRLAETFVEPLE